VCLPHCNSDADCEDGRSCQLSGVLLETPVSLLINSVGFCVQEPVGLQPGEECDPAATTVEDSCSGVCVPTASNSAGAVTVSTCFETCTVAADPSCGTDEAEGRVAVCEPLFTTDGAGDLGGCFRFCDCSDDCGGVEECGQIQDADGQPMPVEGKPGTCVYPLDGDGEPLVYTSTGEPIVILEDCP
jgi:hypothetical protein